ncbi:activating signal cointegrator 1 isoform X3 [Anguilla anguilla]|uniref:activating signal cointegrator 1 isoform X3 n=1 Tax=Anguilla anguilla TaxID=7936 RepID=UPI0015ADD386|nr:activating signal cointegrator 1 isoform X3 [Anguilla anguilla]
MKHLLSKMKDYVVTPACLPAHIDNRNFQNFTQLFSKQTLPKLRLISSCVVDSSAVGSVSGLPGLSPNFCAVCLLVVHFYVRETSFSKRQIICWNTQDHRAAVEKVVCTKEEQKILQRDSNKSQKLRKKLMSDHVRQSDTAEKEILPHEEEQMKVGLEKALQHRDKLLEFDKNSVQRTQVLDDESDYFSTDSNQWLSPGEREALCRREMELLELRHASRKARKITLDFAGRQVLEEGESLNQYYSRFDEAVQAINTGTMVTMSQQPDNPPLRELLNPNILQTAPQWVDMGHREIPQKPQGTVVASEAGLGRAQLRLQDRELQEMFDGGWCLSMHQPWASLLITGIKRVEGRSWYTTHRGRLWIAAAAKRPTPQEISHVEYQYRQQYRTELQFPRQYPTGCLLGCVSMTDCLSQEQYKEQFHETCEDSSSPFMFICSQPQELLIKFPMKGKHKIWKLDSQLHQGARKGLMPSPNLCA